MNVKDMKNSANSKTITLDVPAEIDQGRTMIPLRAVSKAFGDYVQWFPKTQQIGIIQNN